MPQTFVDKRYRILRKIGEGGMGAVYLALDERLEREVALKRLHVVGVLENQREQFIQRFQREAKAMARFSHPNIVHVYDYGQDEEGIYLVLEYMVNGTLKQHMGKTNDPKEAARLLIPIAEALYYIHQRGMVHRDVKPANILFDERRTPKIADFGIVKLLDQEGATLTATGVGIGTPDYMAPEQIGKDFDHHVDQYALGIIFYELVTGKKPYQGDTPIQTLLMHVTEPLPDPRLLVPDLSEAACTVIHTALGKKPGDRFADTDAFIHGLRMVMDVNPTAEYVHNQKPKPGTRTSGEDQLPFDLPVEIEESASTDMEAETRLAEEVVSQVPVISYTEDPTRLAEPHGKVDQQAPIADEEPPLLGEVTPINQEPVTEIAASAAEPWSEEETQLNQELPDGFSPPSPEVELPFSEDVTQINDEQATKIAAALNEPNLEDETRVAGPIMEETPAAVLAAAAKPKQKFPWLWAGIGAAAGVLILLGIFVLPGLLKPSSAPAEVLSEMDVTLTKIAQANEADASQGQDSGAAQNEEPEQPQEPVQTDRKGGWLDEIIVVYAGWDDSVERVSANDIQLSGVAYDQPEKYHQIFDSGIGVISKYKVFYDLTLNPAGNPTFAGNGVFNPFSSPRLRHAVNFLIDRQWMADEIFGGMAQPKWLPVYNNTKEYERYPEVRQVEEQYAFDPGKADEIIRGEMEAMGAEWMDEGWFYQGEPVLLTFIIRNDGNGIRIPIGETIAVQFEQIGFHIDRRYMDSDAAGELWFQSNPEDGSWHMYTGGWLNSGWVRDNGADFQFFSSVNGEYANISPLWQAYDDNDPGYDLTINSLAERRFGSIEERDSLFREAVLHYLDAPYHIFLVQALLANPVQPWLQVAADPIYGALDLPLWPYTMRVESKVGGSTTIGLEMIFCDLLNPVEADCQSDRQWLHAINDSGMMFDPAIQLPTMQRVQTAVVTAVNGLPIREDDSGVQLRYADGIQVPDDAWVDWDSGAQRFITAGQAFSEPREVAVKSVVTYPADLYETVFWHDGSPFSAADVVYHLIFQLKRSTEGSDSYDPSALSPHDNGIVAWRITSTQPLTIEVYRDSWELDAANNVVDLWPNYGASEAPWHLITVANWADIQGMTAFTRTRQEITGAPRIMNWFDPESTTILRELLAQEFENAYIPAPDTLLDYISQDEARMRYENLMNFYDQYGHFFVGTGAYQLTGFERYGHLVLSHNPRYPDPADKWSHTVP